MREEYKLIGRRIKIIRVIKGITQTTLAKEIGVTQTNMSNIECGRVAVTMQNLIKLSKILTCNIGDFFKDIDEREDKR